MKFGDKLIQLRKKNGLSQEELAEKLGVSRQSVSKWESNNTYPETDKIIQIANLFDCSMDDLINDKINDIESTLRKNKNNIQNVWDSLLEFITDTVNMFSKMKFKDGLKCIIEMIILSIILYIIGNIICKTASSIIASIFSFLSQNTVSTIREVLKSIFFLIWFIISLISLIYSFKIKYLNYYVEDKKPKKQNNIENSNKTNNKKMIDIEEKPFEFLSTLSKIVIIFIKFIVFWILIGIVCSTIALIVLDVLTIFHITYHILFLWATLSITAGIIVSIQTIIILVNFIFDKKINVISHLIIFISCILLSGISIGLLAISVKNIEKVNDNSPFNLETKELTIDYKENLVIDNNGLGDNHYFKYIIDNNIEDNKIIVSKQVDTNYFTISTYETSMDQLPVIKVGQKADKGFKTYYDLIAKNLKDNKFVSFEEYGNDPLIIKANENVINKLLDNTKLLYLIKEERNDNEINVVVKEAKVHFKNGLNGKYNALDDTIKYNEENYSCSKEIEKTEYGEKFIYSCHYTNE